MTTLADAIRAQFERDHPRNRNTLKCAACYRRKDRNDFRETPWHGRAASCRECERSTWCDELRLRQAWELEQERERVRMYRRYVAYLRLRRIFDMVPTSADAVRVIEEPYMRAVARASERWTRAIAFAVTTMEENA